MTDINKSANEYFLTRAQYESRRIAGTLEIGAVYHITDESYESTANKVTSLSAQSTDTQYPSAKCVYDGLASKVDVDSAQTLTTAQKAQGRSNIGAEEAGTCLPLSGGTLTASENILSLNSSSLNVWIYFKVGSSNKASVGYYRNFASIANEVGNCARIGVTDSGVPQYWDNSEGGSGHSFNLYHSGNCNNTSTPWSASTLTLNGEVSAVHIYQSYGFYVYPGGENYAFQIASICNNQWGNWLVAATSSGNVGIGTTSPQAKLDVNGGSHFNGSLEINADGDSWNEGIRIHPSANAWSGIVLCEASNSGPSGTSTNTWSIHNNEGVFGIYKNGSNTGVTTYISHDGSNWMIDGGYVGIGTISPSYKLHVNGSAYASYFKAGGDIGVVRGSDDAALISYYPAGCFLGHGMPEIGKDTYIDGINIYARIAATNTIAFSILSSGNVGIGTTSPQYKLHVNGAAAGTSWTNTSDIRLKDVIEDINVSLDDIANAPIFKFTWKDKALGEDEELGTSAQYWEEKVPVAVKVKDDTYGLNYQALALANTVTLAKEVKALKSENEALRSELDELKEMVSRLIK